MALEVGDTVYGFAGGYFGRDSYGDRVVIATGFYAEERWAVFHEKDGYSFSPTFHLLVGEDLVAVEDYTTPLPPEDFF